MKIKLVLFAYLVFFSVASFGQESNDNSTSSDSIKKIVVFETYLKEDSKPYEAFVNVEKDVKYLVLEIDASIEKGRYRIEMYDPKGKKWKKDLVFDSSYNTGNIMKLTHKKSTTDTIPKITVGSVNVVLKKPKDGQWKINFVPEKATGKIRISYSFRKK